MAAEPPQRQPGRLEAAGRLQVVVAEQVLGTEQEQQQGQEEEGQGEEEVGRRSRASRSTRRWMPRSCAADAWHVSPDTQKRSYHSSYHSSYHKELNCTMKGLTIDMLNKAP